MRNAVDLRRDLRTHLEDLNPLVPVRVVTVVPGLEYYGRVVRIGSDYLVLETDLHTVTVALPHIVSMHRDPFHGRLSARSSSGRQVDSPTVHTPSTAVIREMDVRRAPRRLRTALLALVARRRRGR